MPKREREPKVIFALGDIIVLDKPPFLPSDGEDGAEGWLAARHPGFHIAHRLDAMTGGVLCCGRGAAHAELLSLFKSHGLKKEYLAITVGRPKDGRLTNYLSKDARAASVKAVTPKAQGAAHAVMDVRTLYSGGGLSLVMAMPLSGRTHQVRVQLASAGCPVLGDDKYGIREKNRAFGARYQALWAHALEFPECKGALSPVSRMRFVSEPRFPQKALAAMGIDEDALAAIYQNDI